MINWENRIIRLGAVAGAIVAVLGAAALVPRPWPAKADVETMQTQVQSLAVQSCENNLTSLRLQRQMALREKRDATADSIANPHSNKLREDSDNAQQAVDDLNQAIRSTRCK